MCNVIVQWKRSCENDNEYTFKTFSADHARLRWKHKLTFLFEIVHYTNKRSMETSVSLIFFSHYENKQNNLFIIELF